jgi:hypothetical protein
MNRIILTGFILFALAFGACNRKTGLGTSGLICKVPTQAFLSPTAQLKYFIKVGNTKKDSFATRSFTKLLENTYRMADKIMPRDSSYVSYYLKACGSDLFISEIATNLDEQQNKKNLFMKGIRKPLDTWNYTLNNNVFNVGVKDTGLSVILLYDTLKVDKIWRNIGPQKFAPDTFYWSDKYGQVLFRNPDGKIHELYFANY